VAAAARPGTVVWEGAQVQRVLDIVLRRNVARPETPLCPDHDVEMRLRGKLGKPTRFSYQTEEEYTLIYFCPVEGCNQTEMVTKVRTQIPVPGEAPPRPSFARRESSRP
jgi:hypothetical protein